MNAFVRLRLVNFSTGSHTLAHSHIIAAPTNRMVKWEIRLTRLSDSPRFIPPSVPLLVFPIAVRCAESAEVGHWTFYNKFVIFTMPLGSSRRQSWCIRGQRIQLLDEILKYVQLHHWWKPFTHQKWKILRPSRDASKVLSGRIHHTHHCLNKYI